MCKISQMTVYTLETCAKQSDSRNAVILEATFCDDEKQIKFSYV